MIRKISRIFITASAAVVLLVVSLVWEINRSPFKGTEVYRENMKALEEMKFSSTQSDSAFQVGWAKWNITPDNPSTMVGYRPRGPHEGVHDSLFVRTVVFDNGKEEVVLISIDLLIFPPQLREALAERLTEIGMDIDRTYLSATHTHTSFGGWNNSLAGEFITGNYSPEVVALLAENTMQSIKEAKRNMGKVSIGFGQVDANEFVENRLDSPDGIIDPLIRFIKIKKTSGETAAVMSFSAHATSISKKILALSGDYPNALVDALEKSDEIDFSLFCAGMVASHRAVLPNVENFELVKELGDQLSGMVLEKFDSTEMTETSILGIAQVPVLLPDSQLRLTKDLKVRDWVFDALFGGLDASITVFRLGDIVLLGMPCDFSGELYVNSGVEAMAKAKNLHVMVTSFNGKYIGYITDDEHYETKSKEEVMALNWVGPYKGEYFVEILEEILEEM